MHSPRLQQTERSIPPLKIATQTLLQDQGKGFVGTLCDPIV